MAMLDAVYVDTVEEKSVVAIRPKAAFRPIFEVATTREGSGIALINQTPQTQNEPEASGSCSWWRRGRVQPPSDELSRNLGGFKLVQLPGLSNRQRHSFWLQELSF